MIKEKLLLAILCILMLASCKFTEECDYTGNVELTMDWDSLWGNLQKPDSLTALFYREGEFPVKKTLVGDTTYIGIPSGNTDLFVYNHPSNIELRGGGSMYDSELYLPTYFEGNIRAVNECPMICFTNENFKVPVDGTVKQLVTPLPIVKQLIFIVNVVKLGGNMGELSSANASLSGISTGYSLSKKEPIRNKATVFFPLERGKKDTFTHSFFVLGVNPNTPDQQPISNKLTITVFLDDGESKPVDIDLTELFDQFTSNILKCEVDVEISAISSNVTISNWEQGTWHNIVIQ